MVADFIMSLLTKSDSLQYNRTMTDFLTILYDDLQL